MGGERCDQLIVGSTESSLFAMEVPPSGGGEAEATLVGDFHLGRVTAAVALSDGKRFATCGEDGALRVWSAHGGLEAKRQFGTVQNCLAANENTMCILMGSNTGVVRVLNASDLSALPVTFCSKLHREAVTQVAFSPTASMLLSYSTDGRLFICSMVGSVVRVQGFLQPPGPAPLLSIAWTGIDEESSMIVASMNTGEIMGITPPAWGTTVPPSLQYGPRDYTVRRVKIETVLDRIIALAGMDAPIVIGVAPDKTVRRFQLRRDAAFWGGPQGRVLQADDIANMLEKPANALHAVPGGAYLAVAGSEGCVKVLSSDLNGKPVTELFQHDMILGGASAVAMGLTGRYVLTGGMDGSVFISEALPERLVMPQPPVPEIGASYDLDMPDESMELDEIDTRAKKEADRLHRESEDERDAVRKALSALRKIFSDVLARNSQAPLLEQLHRQDFLVDVEMHTKLQKEGMTKVDAVREEIQRETLRMKLQRERVLETTRDTTEVPLQTVVGVKNSALSVSSFGLEKKTNDSWKLKKALMLRKVEMKMQRAQFLVNGEMAWRVELDEAGNAVPNKKLAQLEVQDEELLNDSASMALTDSNNVQDLMYSDMDLHCRTRKSLQVLILQQLVHDKKEAFNNEVLAMVNRKSADTDKIADLNARIEERARELFKLTGDEEALSKELAALFAVDHNDERERDDTRFEVADEEVGVEKYVSPEEEERLRLEAEAQAKLAAKAAGDGSVVRALTMMMGGTLERPDDGTAEFKVERPEWLDTDPKTWSEEQFKEAKEYEQRQKAAEDEKAKRIQTVETELRTLKANIEDTSHKFDEALTALANQKLTVSSDLLQTEFRAIRLLSGVEMALEYSDMAEDKLLKGLEELKIRREKNNHLLTDTRRKVENQREKVEHLVSEDKHMDKGFRKDFAESDTHLPALVQLFKRRVVKQSSAARAQSVLDRPLSSGSTAMADHTGLDDDADDEEDSLDPFPGASAEKGPSEEPPLNPATDRPQGLDSYWWDSLVRARNAKLRLEAEVRRETDVLQKLQMHLQKLSKEDDVLSSSIAKKEAQVSDFMATKGRHELNLEVPLKLQQGQVEAEPPHSTVSDMSHALLLHRKGVEDINAVIHQKGSKKVSILTAIKDFKKGSYELEWNIRKLDRQGEDLVELTKELQLLHVTKDLQRALKQGVEQEALPQEQTNFEQIMKHNAAIHKKNVIERARKLQRLQNTCQEKQMQNYECQHQIEVMQMKLGEQARIAESQKDTTAGMTPAKRMKSLVTHKRLKEISAAQNEELAILRAEVERLNLRTYPSFVEPQQVYYPDDSLPGPRA